MASGAPAAPLGSGSSTSPLLDALMQLSSLDASTRVSATANILHYLKGAQKHFEETALKHSSALAVVPMCHDLDYVIKRLTRGLASSNAAARQGFSSALTELLRVFDFVPTIDVLTSILKATALGARAGRDEVRDAMLGRIFGFLVLQRAGKVESLRGQELASTLAGKGLFSFSKTLRGGASNMASGEDGSDGDDDEGDAEGAHSNPEVQAASSPSRYQPTTVIGFLVTELISIASKKMWAFDVALESAAVIVASAGKEAWAQQGQQGGGEDLEGAVDAAIPSDPTQWAAEHLNLVLAIEECLVQWGLCPPPEGSSEEASQHQQHELAASALPSYILELRKGLNRSFLQRFVLMAGDEDGAAGDDEQLAAIARAQTGTTGNDDEEEEAKTKKDDKKNKKMDVDGSDSDSESDNSDSSSLPSRDSDDEDDEDAEDEKPLPVSAAPFANAILGSTKAYPRLHSVWGRLLQRYAKTAFAPLAAKVGAARAAAVSAPPSEAVLEFAEVWRVYVDCLLMSQGPERKAASMALLTSVLPHAAEAHPAVIDAILSLHLIRSLVRNLAQKSRMLHAPARAVIGTLLISCKGKSDISSVALVALVARGHPDFDKRTATRAVATLLSNLNEDDVLRHIAGAQREFVKPSAAPLYSDLASQASGLTGRSNAIRKDGGDGGSVRSGRSGRSAMTNTDPDVKAAEGEDDDADLAMEKPRTLSPVESRRLWALDTITAALRNDGLRVLRKGPVMKAILSFLGLHAFADVGASEETMEQFEKAGLLPSSSSSSAASTDGKKRRKSSLGSAAEEKKESATIAALRALAAHVVPPTQVGAVDPRETSPLLVADPPLSVYMRSELRLRLVALVRHVTIAESVLASKSKAASSASSQQQEEAVAGAGILPDGTSVVDIHDNNSRGALELYSLGSLLNRVWDDIAAVQHTFLNNNNGSNNSSSAKDHEAAAEQVQLSLFPSVELVKKAEAVAESSGMAGLEDDSEDDDEEDDEGSVEPVKARQQALKLASLLHTTGLSLLKASAALRGPRSSSSSSSSSAAAAATSDDKGKKAESGKHGHGSNATAAAVLETARFCLNYAALLQQVSAHLLLEGGRGLGLEHASALPGLGLAVGAAPTKAAKDSSDSEDDEEDDEQEGGAVGGGSPSNSPSDAIATAAGCASLIASCASALDDMTKGCYHLLARSLNATSSALASAAITSASAAPNGTAPAATGAPTPKSGKKDKKDKSAANTPAASSSDGSSGGSSSSSSSPALHEADKAICDALAALVAFAPEGTKASAPVSLEEAEKACVIFTDSALSLLASSTSTLRQAIKSAGRFVFGNFVTVEAVESLLAVISRASTANKKDDEEDDDEMEGEESSDDDEDSENEEDDTKGKKKEQVPAAKRQKKEDKKGGNSDDSDDSGFSISDEEDADKKKKGIGKKSKKGDSSSSSSDSDSDSNSDSDSESEGGDFGFSEMEKYDRMLSAMIKARQQAKSDVKKQKLAETHFKQRALDLLTSIVQRLKHPKTAASAAFVSKADAAASNASSSSSSSQHHADARLFLLPAPILRAMRILAARSRARPNASNVKGGDEKAAAAETAAFEAQELLAKLQELLQETLTARLPAQVDAASQQPLLSLFSEAIEAVQTAPTTEFVNACASACGVVLKALRPTPQKARLLLTKETLADEKRRNSALAACVQQPSVEHLDKLASGYASALATLLTEPHTRLGPSFFKTIFSSTPALGVRLLPTIASVITSDAVSKPFRRAESLLSIGTIVKASSSGWSKDVPCATAAAGSTAAPSSDKKGSGKKDKKGGKGEKEEGSSAVAAELKPEELLSVITYLRGVLPSVLSAIAHEVDRAAKGSTASEEKESSAASIKPLGPKPLKEAISTVTMLQKAKLACIPETEDDEDEDTKAASEKLYSSVSALLSASSSTFPEHLRQACSAVLEKAGREVPAASAAVMTESADDTSPSASAEGDDDNNNKKKEGKKSKKDKASGEKRKHGEAFDEDEDKARESKKGEEKKKDKKEKKKEKA